MLTFSFWNCLLTFSSNSTWDAFALMISKLLNGDYMEGIISREETSLAKHTFFHRIRVVEVKKALTQIKTIKATGSYDIPIKARKCLGEIEGIWLTRLFNKTLMTKKEPTEWRKSLLVPLYKNKWDIQNCSNNRGIKVMSHAIKLWERITQHGLRQKTKISENQFGFMPGRSTMEAIFVLVN